MSTDCSVLCWHVVTYFMMNIFVSDHNLCELPWLGMQVAAVYSRMEWTVTVWTVVFILIIFSSAIYFLPLMWFTAFSALTLLVGWQEGHPACNKTERWGAGVVICLKRGADLHVAQLMSMPLTVSCSSKIQIGFTFLVPAYLGSPGKMAVKTSVCVCNVIYLHIMVQCFSALHLQCFDAVG